MKKTITHKIAHTLFGALTASVALTFCVPASAQTTVFQDDFTSAALNPLPYNSSSPVGVTSGSNVYVNSGFSGLLNPTGGVLGANNTSGSGTAILTYIAPSGSPVQLALGEQIEVTFDVALMVTPAAPSTLRVALLNSGGTRPIYASTGLLSAGSSGATVNSATQAYLNWAGYRADMSMVSKAVGVWERLVGANTALISTNATWNNAAVQASVADPEPTPPVVETFYNMKLTIYRTPQDAVWVSSTVSGGDLTAPITTGTWVDTNTWGGSATLPVDAPTTPGVTTAFDTLVFNVASGHQYQFDNISIVKSVPVQGRLTNLSIRTGAGSGAETLIAGFVASGGSENASLLVRAAGPALIPHGVTGVLADPQLAIYNAVPAVVQSNDDWSSTLADTFTQVGAFPWTVGSKDSALALSLAPAPYTAQVTGVGGTTGIALAEIYDVNTTFAATKPQLVNVSARAQVNTGENIMIAGFVVGGDTAQRVLIRAVGPTLTNYGVTGVLADPQLTIFSGATQIGGNDDWDAALAATFAQIGASPLDAASKDAALLVMLDPGVYTAQASGVGDTTGVALVEVYAVP